MVYFSSLHKTSPGKVRTILNQLSSKFNVMTYDKTFELYLVSSFVDYRYVLISILIKSSFLQCKNIVVFQVDDVRRVHADLKN